MAAQVSLKSDAQARVVKKGTAPWALPTWVADFNPLHAGASVQTCPELAVRTLLTKPALFNILLGRHKGGNPKPLETGVLTGCVEDWLGRHVGVRAKRDLLHHPAEREREYREGDREEEHGLQSVTERIDDEGPFGDR